MSPELIYEPPTSLASSSPGNSTTLVSLIFVKFLKFVLASFLGEQNKHLTSDGVDSKSNKGDHNGEQANNHGTNDFIFNTKSLDMNHGPLVFGEDKGIWNGLSLPSTIPEVILALQFSRTFFTLCTDVVNVVLNKYRLDRETTEEKMEEHPTQSSHPRIKRRAIKFVKPKTKYQNYDQVDSSGFSVSLQVAFQYQNISLEIPFKTWNL